MRDSFPEIRPVIGAAFVMALFAAWAVSSIGHLGTPGPLTAPPMLARLLLAGALGACVMRSPVWQAMPRPDGRATRWHRAAYAAHLGLAIGAWWLIGLSFQRNDIAGNLGALGLVCVVALFAAQMPPHRKRPGPAAPVFKCKATAAFDLWAFLAGGGAIVMFGDALLGAAVMVVSMALITQATAEDGIPALGWYAGTLAPVVAALALLALG